MAGGKGGGGPPGGDPPPRDPPARPDVASERLEDGPRQPGRPPFPHRRGEDRASGIPPDRDASRIPDPADGAGDAQGRRGRVREGHTKPGGAPEPLRRRGSGVAQMDYEGITGLAKHHKQAFGRIVKCEMYQLEEGKILALTRMHDDYHDMNLAILLDGSYRIEAIGGKMDRIPYPCCEDKPLAMLSNLTGISVLERGGLKKVKERIPRNAGCSHVYEMIESTFRAIFVGSYSIVDRNWNGGLSLGLGGHPQLPLASPLVPGT